MTLIEAITKIDSRKHNTYSKEEKIRWLSVLDGIIKHQILDRHEGPQVTFHGYGPETPDDTELLVMEPFDEVYLWYLAAQIDYCNGEMTGYNNSIALFNHGYSIFADAYTRGHKPLGTGEGFN